MRARRGSLVAPLLLAALLLCGLAAYASGVHTRRSPGRSGAAAARRASEDVRLGGHAAGLYPGSARRLRVHVDNLGERPLTVRSVGAVVGDPPARRCPADDLSVSAHRGAFRLQPHGRRWVALTISMRSDAADACQRARFPLAYRARVTP
jgi:hypothetical protein